LPANVVVASAAGEMVLGPRKRSVERSVEGAGELREVCLHALEQVAGSQQINLAKEKPPGSQRQTHHWLFSSPGLVPPPLKPPASPCCDCKYANCASY